jgi:hypothetical protein
MNGTEPTIGPTTLATAPIASPTGQNLATAPIASSTGQNLVIAGRLQGMRPGQCV